MKNLPSIEILEATHRFPTQYTFKAIGKEDGDFIARVVSSVRAELKLDADPPYSFRQTSDGKHVAVTLEARVASASQIQAVYKRILTVEGLLLLF